MRIGAFFSLIVGIQEADEELVSAAFRRRKSERKSRHKLPPEIPEHFRDLVTRGLANSSDYFEFVEQRGVAQKRLEAILGNSIEDESSMSIVASPILFVSQVFQNKYKMIR
ncbi:unnamed protein product, partial [Mesorhabditis belari]|uniref:Uncharacterized protein n=1 Tax=Mesorhabditis belari TaxID=2138241 RepID=A0AAF3EA68_9BILA